MRLCAPSGAWTAEFRAEARNPSTKRLHPQRSIDLESLGNNHGFIDGNKPIAFVATDVFLRRNGSYIEVEGLDGHAFIDGSIDRHELRFAQILDWIRQYIKPLV